MKKILVIYHPLLIDDMFIKEYIEISKSFKVKVICANKLNMWKWFSFNGIRVEKSLLKQLDFGNYEMINYSLPFLRNLFEKKALDSIIEFNPDIIHIYSELFSPSLSQVIHLRNKHLKWTKIINYSWENLDFNKFPYSLFGKYNAKNIDKVLCANDEAILEVQKFWVNENKIQKIYWWTDLVNFPYTAHTIANRNIFSLLFIWRLLKDKWLQDILFALKELWRNFKLQIIWDWSDKQFFFDLVDELWIPDQVIFLWKIAHDKINEYFNDSDIFILPSRTKKGWKEQFWRVIPEAMACWVPVIWSSSWAIPEVIWDAWLIFEEWNSNNLALKIRNMLSNSEEYAEFSAKWIKRVKGKFSTEVFVQNLIKVYSSVI
ncbi:MAG: group 1 glycosyl transferase [uncultured bacterium (gcode 4)]|uniref:Group 1 glycosyl transferase n=1 Tax=uncultured bacterium (gcode 4) TaxID=1234023 RepID=K2FXP0_9BACT|nr:MAG: group 1 glycosyl transferase [uncultured bacterium (gcode 4)]